MFKITGYIMAGLLILSGLGLFGCGGGGGGGSTGGETNIPVTLSVTNTSPGSGDTGVTVNAHITVTFNSDMDSDTVNSSTFLLTGPDGPVGGSVSYDSGSKTATFSPLHPLPPLTLYTATVTPGAKNVSGSTLSSQYSWSFTTLSGFWAYNFATDSYYFVNAGKVGEGRHCYVYLEQGKSADPATLAALVNEFDSAIYPGDTNAFGSEPNPGVDGDPKIYLLLLDIKDGFNPSSAPTYVAGYFDPANEYTADQNTKTNLKEMFYMDISPSTPGSTDFYATLAHEFQHMIHWEQKTNLQGLNDDTWLDEGMSSVARTYCGLGADTPGNTAGESLLSVYEEDPSHSLTVWDSTIDSYAVTYMWSQYFKDRFDPQSGQYTIFWRMIHNDRTGIASVDAALTGIDPGKFYGTFRDWTIANAFGNIPPLGHQEWSYTSLAGWHGLYLEAPGSIAWNTQTLSALARWSAGYYAYAPNPNGTITWNRPAGSPDTASLIDTGGSANAGSWKVTDPLTAGTTYSYTRNGYLVNQNPAGSSGGGDGVINKALAVTPRQLLKTAGRNPLLLNHYRRTGTPTHICVDSYFRDKERELRAGGARPHFGRSPGR
jgi:hypothetical protein